LEINASYACSGGIEINPQRMYVCLEDFCGTILFEKMQEIDADSYAQKGFLGFLKEGIELLQAAAERLRIKLAGIGLGIPGMVESDGGRIIQSIPLLIEDGLDVAKDIQPLCDIPIFVENDARCCCYTEQILSRGPKTQNMMYVLAEHRPLQPVKDSPKNLSVGLGLILNGKIYHGAYSTAGEFRSVFWDSPSKSQFSPACEVVKSLDDQTAVQTFRELAKKHSLFGQHPFFGRGLRRRNRKKIRGRNRKIHPRTNRLPLALRLEQDDGRFNRLGFAALGKLRRRSQSFGQAFQRSRT